MRSPRQWKGRAFISLQSQESFGRSGQRVCHVANLYRGAELELETFRDLCVLRSTLAVIAQVRAGLSVLLKDPQLISTQGHPVPTCKSSEMHA